LAGVGTLGSSEASRTISAPTTCTASQASPIVASDCLWASPVWLLSADAPIQEREDAGDQLFVVTGEKTTTTGVLDEPAEHVALTAKGDESFLEGRTSVGNRVVGFSALDLRSALRKASVRRRSGD
jgi:hypothetical protein